MPINTDLNVYPYFDDFDTSKNYHRIVFNPHKAVQARELTQLQTILQDQIEMFGDNILRQGTIVTGGNFVEEQSLSFVRLMDNNSIGTGISVSSYDGMTIYGTTSNIKAVVVATASGLETQAPNTNTIWVKYLNSAAVTNGNDIKNFADGEYLEVRQYRSTGAYTVIDTPIAIKPTAANGNIPATGFGYGVRCGDGVIYQKGNFIRFTDGITIISKYDNVPDGVVVGFETKEELINSYADTSLLDNANSFNNYNAPGADRLKLTPVLTTKSLADAIADEKFFALQEYKSGKVIRRKLDTVYNKLGDMMARRTAEESGNYVVHGFDVGVEDVVGTSNLTLSVSPGIGYVNGYRVELVNNYKVEVSQSTEALTDLSQNVLADYGNYVVVNNSTGKFDLKNLEVVNLVDAANATIGTAKLRTLSKNDSLSQKLYLTDIKMNLNKSFGSVTQIKSSTGTGSATVTTASLKSASSNNLLFDVGQSHLKSVSNFQYSYRTYVDKPMTAGSFTITSNSGNEFPIGASIQSADIIAIDTSTGAFIDLSAATVSSASATQMTISTGSTATNVRVYYNAIKTAAPMTKTLATFTVTANINAGTVNGFSLGVPDGYQLTSVKVNNIDKTSNFTLNSGQTDAAYGLASVSVNTALTVGDTVVVVFTAFVASLVGGEQTYFNVNSYTGPSTFTEGDIPTYTSEDGTVVQLRDVIDFRPVATATFAGLAATNPSNTEVFANVNTPAPYGAMSLACDYYVGRYDKILMDENGQIKVSQGKPAENPLPPADQSLAMTLGTFYIPPYPALSLGSANRLGKLNYTVRFSKADNRRYTMNDIRAIDQRVENLAYYTSLSLLEQNTLNLTVQDANGNNRFKNGIWVESFKDFRISDITSSEFAASIDPSDEALGPSFTPFTVDLKVSSVIGVTNYGETALLDSKDATLIEQPYATAVKNCTTSLYNFKGSLSLFPENDSSPDLVNPPDVILGLDANGVFSDFNKNMTSIVTLQTSTRRKGRNTRSRSRSNVSTTTTTSEKIQTNNARVTSSKVGDFVTDLTMSPYMRSKEIKVFVSGLRPNTKFWPYFDQRDVSAYCAPAIYNTASTSLGLTSTVMNNANMIVKSGVVGSELRSNANGNLYAVFYLPENMFKIGDRTFELIDVPTYTSIDALTSYASRTYSAFNFNITKTGVSTSTRPPQTTPPAIRRNRDPLIQSFIIDPDASDESSTILTGVDLYFNSKSATAGISVMIREMRDGVPTSTTVPFSEVQLTSSQVNVSTNGSAVTTVKFNSPIPIKTNVEYGLCLFPDGGDPDYKVFISRTGETDLLLNQVVTHDTNSGMIFTSTNNRTWTPYQNENLKFKMHSAEFTTSTGTLTLEPNDMEFFELTNLSGSFIAGEKVYIKKTTYDAGNLNLVAGSNSVIGSGTTFNTLNAGDWLFAEASTTPQLLKISEGGVVSSTKLSLIEIPTITSNAVKWYRTTVANVSQFITNNGPKLIVDSSSAKITNSGILQAFNDGDTVVGLSSGATATIKLVNQKVSFVQPNIRRADFVGTTLNMSGKFNNGSSASTTSYDMPFDDSVYLDTNDSYIPSKSIMLKTPSVQPTKFEITLIAPGTGNTSSPVIDHGGSSLICYEYLVNNTATTENTTSGNAKAKYVSKLASLADGMDAVDMKVLLSAYRPLTTDVKVYVKLISASDGRLPSNVGWTEMVLSPSSNFYSSSVDQYDYREFEFELPSTVSANTDTASYDGTNFKYLDDVKATYTNYKYFAFKIVMLAESHKLVPRVSDARAMSLT